MGCLRLCMSKKRPEAAAWTPASPTSAATFSSTVSAEPCSIVSTLAAASASVASSSATATSPSSDAATGGARPAAASNSSSAGSLSSARRSIPELYEERGARSLREFGLRELRAATGDFSPLLLVGEGGFGCVYRGVLRLPAGTPVAVKRLNPNGRQGHKEWLAEVHFLGVVEHPNLVRLVGYCSAQTERGPQRLLVYEFMANKTLDDHLFNRAYPVLPWDVRLQIALGAAEGLLYLHEGLELQIIYRDFKASNILLDEEFRPKLSDFGLAREGPSEGQTHVSTAVMGTYGYAAPDYVQTGHLTTKSDVWSFGVVLYEILTGRRSVERGRPRAEQKLLEWVRRHPAEGDRFGEIVDAKLQGRYSMRGAREVARLADGCLARHARDRPSMAEVVRALRQAMRHEELDGGVYAAAAPAVEGSSGSAPHGAPPPPGRTPAPEEEDVAVAAARRRMLHLSALGENASAHATRRLMLMRAAAAAAAT